MSVAEIVIALAGALGLGTLTQKLMDRRKDGAETDRTSAEAEKVDADADAVRVTSVSSLLAEIRQLRTEHHEETRSMRSEYETLRAEVAALRQDAHRAEVRAAAHDQWDLMVLAEVHKTTPDFPTPPPLREPDTGTPGVLADIPTR